MSKTAQPGFSFIEIMGALLIFSLLGTTLIVSQGSMMRAVNRIVYDIESIVEGRVVFARAQTSGELFLGKEEPSKIVTQQGPLTDSEYQVTVQAFNKEGAFKDFVPGQFGAVSRVGTFTNASEELFVFILGPNYIQPAEEKNKNQAGSGQQKAVAKKTGGGRTASHSAVQQPRGARL